MNIYILIILCLGIMFMLCGYSNRNNNKQHTKIIYRYVPRTFEEEQEDRASIDQMFSKMFNRPSVWVDGGNDSNNYITQ